MEHEQPSRNNVHPKEIIDAYTAAVHNPFVVYRLCKDIDGYKGEGTFNLMGARVVRRYHVYDRQVFYEPLSTYDQILEVQEINRMLMEGGAPQYLANLDLPE